MIEFLRTLFFSLVVDVVENQLVRTHIPVRNVSGKTTTTIQESSDAGLNYR